MSSSNYELSSFFKKIESQLKKNVSIEQVKSDLKELALINEECFFIVDLSNSKIIQFGGMKKLFGYDEKIIDLEFVFDKNHPEDTVIVQKIIKAIVSKVVQMKIPTFTNIFSITSRFRKTNGEYLRILTDNFVIQTNDDNLVQSILIRYTDLSFLGDSKAVDWKVNSDYLDKASISNEIYGEEKNIFTEREKEVVLLVIVGSSNSEIASSLSISKHTVATHRKNIYSKSNCSDQEELKIFCKKNGVFNGNNF